MLSVATAFVPSSSRSPVLRSVRPAVRPQQMKPTQMSLDITQLSSETLNTVEQLNNLVVASSSSDWGGLAGPIAGLGFLVGVIVLLAPPVSD